jgi:hypothetical protein
MTRNLLSFSPKPRRGTYQVVRYGFPDSVHLVSVWLGQWFFVQLSQDRLDKERAKLFEEFSHAKDAGFRGNFWRGYPSLPFAVEINKPWRTVSILHGR